VRLVQRFVNTNDREGGVDRLASPAALSRWFREAGVRVGRLEGRDLARAIELREALRVLLGANNGLPLEAAALDTLNSALTGAGICFGATRPALTPRGVGIDYALGHIVAAVFHAMVEGTWPRLKACRRDACQWAFYDQSKNQSGSWCTMEICGNRSKTSAYWRRRQTAHQS
jgi:predicted RNA-binding Zn ribbon-like protein